jgi:hypothetical protein
MNKLTDTNNRSVELHIDELVFHGFERADRYALANAVEQELARLFSEQGIPAPTAVTERRSIQAGDFVVAPGREANRIGAQVAGSVYEGLSGVASPRRR